MIYNHLTLHSIAVFFLKNISNVILRIQIWNRGISFYRTLRPLKGPFSLLCAFFPQAHIKHHSIHICINKKEHIFDTSEVYQMCPNSRESGTCRTSKYQKLRRFNDVITYLLKLFRFKNEYATFSRFILSEYQF